jgi:hypothetical protein
MRNYLPYDEVKNKRAANTQSHAPMSDSMSLLSTSFSLSGLGTFAGWATVAIAGALSRSVVETWAEEREVVDDIDCSIL